MSREQFYCQFFDFESKVKKKKSLLKYFFDLDDLLTEKVRRNKLQISLDYNVESTLYIEE